MSGAIEMVAFGVLEYKPIPFKGTTDKEYMEKFHLAHDILKLVEDVFNSRGWLLSPKYPSNDFVLLGATDGKVSFKWRPKIAEGTLKKVCRAAVEYDRLREEEPQ